MSSGKAYSSIALSRSMRVVIHKIVIVCSILLVISPPIKLFAQEESVYDEIIVFLEVPRLGGVDISAVIKDEDLYLPVTDLFDFLKIRNIPDQDLKSISGFFVNPDATYEISRTNNQIHYNGNIFNLEKGDLIRTESNLYLRSTYFGKVFGLECSFNFRSLSVSVESKLELPLIREMKQEEMRKNIINLKGEVSADTTIGRSYPLFKSGVADWSVIGTEEINGHSEARINIALGSMIAGGEATASITYNSLDPFTEKQQYYLWRYVNNDFNALRQIRAGKIATQSISSIYDPVVGVQLTNTPTSYRRSFGTYTLSDRTEPGWIVELYINNILVNYVKADASGFFTFQVPLVYGNSIIQLKFFGPWGEEKTKEQNINIPFNFLPVKTLEYTGSAGIVEDSLRSRFSRIAVNYGLSRSLTLGGGVEYLSSVISGPVMPYMNAFMRITNNLLISVEYTYGVRAKGTLSYRLPSNMQFDLNYSLYDRDQKAIKYNYREERKAVLSAPVRIGKFSSFQRLSLYQIVFPASRYTTGEWLFSGSLLGINTNLTTYALFIEKNKPFIYSNMSMALRLPAGYVFMPQLQYGYTQNKLLTAKATLEKHIKAHAYLNMSYEQNFTNKMKMAEFGFRYDFSFAQTGYSVRQNGKKTTLIQYARGSLITDLNTKYLGKDNRTNVGKGEISVKAFLDINSNGQRDEGEPAVCGLNVRANGGHIERNEQDTIIRILGLEPNTSCFLELDPNSFDNVSWRLPFRTLRVSVDPNVMKNFQIPVKVVGEATGNVILDKSGEKRGLGRMIIGFYLDNSKLIGKTLTEADGYFNYFGLAPGTYTVRIDTNQLNILGMSANPDLLKFNIAPGTDGEIVDGLDFIVTIKSKDSSSIVIPEVVQKPVVRKDTSYMIVHEVSQELVTITEDSYAIQLGAFRRKGNAEALRKKLNKLLGKDVEIVIENDFYKVRVSDLKDRKEVDENLLLLRLNGISEVWLLSLKAKQQQLVFIEKQDSIRKIEETIIEQPIPIVERNMTIQAGAFRKESNATDLKNRLEESIDRIVEIVPENGYFKVRISGLVNKSEIEKLLSSLGTLGLHDIWILPVKSKAAPLSEIREKEASQPAIEQSLDNPPLIESKIVVESDTTVTNIENNTSVPAISDKPSKPEPTISLQAGVFLKKTEALRAKRRISKKLNLSAEIIQQWDYYHVIIPGFYTRQETYKYYPELAGIGYSKISIIGKK